MDVDTEKNRCTKLVLLTASWKVSSLGDSLMCEGILSSPRWCPCRFNVCERIFYGKTAITGGQGFDWCNCKTGCSLVYRCICKKEGKECNWKWHGSLSCTNKLFNYYIELNKFFCWHFHSIRALEVSCEKPYAIFLLFSFVNVFPHSLENLFLATYHRSQYRIILLRINEFEHRVKIQTILGFESSFRRIFS